MNNLKKIIIILIMVFIVILLTIAILINSIKKEPEESIDYDLPVEIGVEHEAQLNKELSLIQSENDFFTLENQIKNFFLYYKAKNKNAVYELIDNKYIEEKNITNENVIEKISAIYDEKENDFSLKKAYVRNSMVKTIHYILGTIEKDKKIENCYMIIYWDQENIAFSIKPISEYEYNKYITEQETEENKFVIEQKQYNKLKKTTLTDEEKAEKYFKNYIKNAIYNVEESYAMLNEQYKVKKFPNIQTYKQYLTNRKNELYSMDTDNIKTLTDFQTEEQYRNYINSLQFKGLSKYSFTNTVNDKNCICIDSYGNYYIFNITGAMTYTVILDTYTIDLPEFIEKYDKGTEEQKLQLNVGKILESIKHKDYQYVYNKLDNTFKNNNFKNINSFENYIKNNFYENSEIKEFNYRKEGSVYICTLGISNKDKSSETKSVTILMKLLENREYVISFSI